MVRARPALEADCAAWDAFVAGRPEGDPLQTWAWGKLSGTVGERPLRLLVKDLDGRVRGLAQAVVRPAGFGRQVLYAPHGPLWEREAPDAEELLRTLLGALGEAARREHGIVIKLDPRATPEMPADTLATALTALGLRRARHDLQARTTRLVDLLDGGEALMKTWHADARRLSRRSGRESVVTTVDRVGDPAAVADFHRLLLATAERGDFRIRTLDFLQGIARALATSGGWFLVLARWEERAIAGMALPRVGDRAFYLYGASLKDPALKHKYGAYACMAAGMRALAEDGVRSLDMWGVAEPDDPAADPAWEGFSAFKRTFGGTPLRHPGTFDLIVGPFWYRVRDLREQLRERAGERARAGPAR